MKTFKQMKKVKLATTIALVLLGVNMLLTLAAYAKFRGLYLIVILLIQFFLFLVIAIVRISVVSNVYNTICREIAHTVQSYLMSIGVVDIPVGCGIVDSKGYTYVDLRIEYELDDKMCYECRTIIERYLDNIELHLDKSFVLRINA